MKAGLDYPSCVGYAQCRFSVIFHLHLYHIRKGSDGRGLMDASQLQRPQEEPPRPYLAWTEDQYSVKVTIGKKDAGAPLFLE